MSKKKLVRRIDRSIRALEAQKIDRLSRGLGFITQELEERITALKAEREVVASA